MPRKGYAPNYGYSLRVFDEAPMGYAEDFAVYPLNDSMGMWQVSGPLLGSVHASLADALAYVAEEIKALIEEDA